jgi:hypothetical protein
MALRKEGIGPTEIAAKLGIGVGLGVSHPRVRGLLHR